MGVKPVERNGRLSFAQQCSTPKSSEMVDCLSLDNWWRATQLAVERNDLFLLNNFVEPTRHSPPSEMAYY